MYLRTQKLMGNDDPLFPATRTGVGKNQQLESQGLTRTHWSDGEPIRRIFQDAFRSAGLPYFGPHSFRKTLVMLGEQLCSTPEQFKAWSQNLGHDQVLTTFLNYGEVSSRRQASIMRDLADQGPSMERR
jgi:integrase